MRDRISQLYFQLFKILEHFTYFRQVVYGQKKEVRRFAKTDIEPYVAEYDESGEYPYEIMKKMGKLGFMGIPFPEEYGGMGGDWVGMHICIEEISKVDGTLGAMLDISTSVVGQELMAFGTEEQKQKFLVPIAKGEKIGAFGLTEPNAGSDAGAMATTAKLALTMRLL